MKYVKLFEQFINESEDKHKAFVEWFDLADIDSYDDAIKKFIKKFIKLYKKNKIDDIKKEYSDYEQMMKSAYEEYHKELLRLSLPQGDLQAPTPEIPKVEIK
jgi:hypothetical protein